MDTSRSSLHGPGSGGRCAWSAPGRAGRCGGRGERSPGRAGRGRRAQGGVKAGSG